MGVKEFKEKIVADAEFAAKFENVNTAEELVEIATKEGYNFTVEDVNNNTELIDAELEAVAGGKSIFAKTYFVKSGDGGGSIFASGYFVKR